LEHLEEGINKMIEEKRRRLDYASEEIPKMINAAQDRKSEKRVYIIWFKTFRHLISDLYELQSRSLRSFIELELC
jgi:hypothetical protein